MSRRKRKKEAPIPETQVDYIDNQITFAGAVIKYWEQLCTPWNEDTQKYYRSHYLDVLGPYFLERPLAEYDDPSYYNEVIDAIRKSKASKKKKAGAKVDATPKQNNEPKTDPMQHYRYILYRLIRIASAGEGFANPLLGSDFMKENIPPPEVIAAKERALLQKSFSPEKNWRSYGFSSNPIGDWPFSC